MRKDKILTSIRHKLIVSCQALPGEPLYDEKRSIMPYMAIAAKEAGSPMIRTSSVRDVMEIKEVTGLPVIGLIKRKYEGFDAYITATMKEVDELVAAKADIIALDMTDRLRGDGNTPCSFFRKIKKKYPDQMFLADISTLDEGIAAEAAGADFVSTTMSGYTDYTGKSEGPDFKLVEMLVKTLRIPVFAEGRIHTPDEAVQMLQLGACAVIVGGAITRPLEIAKRFCEAIDTSDCMR